VREGEREEGKERHTHVDREDVGAAVGEYLEALSGPGHHARRHARVAPPHLLPVLRREAVDPPQLRVRVRVREVYTVLV
jgi:hypothetical protein